MKRITLGSLIAAAAVFVPGHPSGAYAEPTARPAEPAIVFARKLGANSDLFRRDADGTVRRLTNTRAYEAFPTWSPDRRHVAYTRDGDIWVMRADGNLPRRLAGGTSPGADLYPAWSPDGRSIVFASTRAGGENELYVMRRDGTDVRRLTRTPRWIDDTQPRFSPDGRFILFTANRPSFFNYELYRIRVRDEGGLTRLTFWGSGDDGAPGDDLQPAYSPYGSLIAFTSDRSGDNALWTMTANGGDLREIARHPGEHVMFPRFSPDGGSLVYTVVTERGNGVLESRLWIVRLDGRRRTELGPGREAEWVPANFTITSRSIGGAALGLRRADYVGALPGRARLNLLGERLARLVFSSLGLDVYLSAGKGVALVAYDSRFRTAKSVGPCSPATALIDTYGDRLQRIPTSGAVTLYRLGTLVFRVANARVGAVAVGRGSIAAQAAGNSIDCREGR
jgi:Tol biopolymer transport system component